MNLEILFEDKYIIVAKKPPKVPSQSDKTGDNDMISILKKHLKEAYPKAKNPYIGLIHRLDRPVGGIMVFAKTKEANANLSEQIRKKKFKKEYHAVLCGKVESSKGELRDYLKRLRKINMSKVVTKEAKDSKEAILDYELIQSVENEEYGVLSLVKIALKTGRHHQIRVQFANVNLPLWGDNKYNKLFTKMKKWTQIALCATKVSFNHPKDNSVCTFELKPQEEFPFTLFNFNK